MAHPEDIEAWELDDVIKKIEAEEGESNVTMGAEKGRVEKEAKDLYLG